MGSPPPPPPRCVGAACWVLLRPCARAGMVGRVNEHGRPAYDDFANLEGRSALAAAFAKQVLTTIRPWLPKAAAELDVLDIGSGYGATGEALAESCRTVVGLEPMPDLHRSAMSRAGGNLSFRLGGVESLMDREAYDLIVLDNVYEHLPNQSLALDRISAALRPGGVLYLLTPNRLWPIEAHYRLPFLAWLPLPLANRYLRAMRRGVDYADASYAPTLWGLRRAFAAHPELEWNLTLPGEPGATMAGSPLHYRVGMAALRRWPGLWGISKLCWWLQSNAANEPGNKAPRCCWPGRASAAEPEPPGSFGTLSFDVVTRSGRDGFVWRYRQFAWRTACPPLLRHAAAIAPQ